MERTILTRKYELNIHELGWRSAEILMLVENGKADYVAKELIDKFVNITAASMRINSGSNLAVSVSYRNSSELHELMENIRRMPSTTNIQWTEIVREIGDRNQRLSNLIFNANQPK